MERPASALGIVRLPQWAPGRWLVDKEIERALRLKELYERESET